jgi:hypothetical protein
MLTDVCWSLAVQPAQKPGWEIKQRLGLVLTSLTASPIEALPKSNAQTMEPTGRVVTDWRLRRRCAVSTAQLWHIQDLLRERLINEKEPVDKSEIEVVVA